MNDKQAILDAALALGEDDRAEIAEILLESLGPEEEDEEAALRAEWQRRREELARDPSVGIPWSEVKKML